MHRRHGLRRRLELTIALAAIVGAPISTTALAQAQNVTVGSPLSGPIVSAKTTAAGTFFNPALGEPGANVVSPISGAIVNSHAYGTENGSYTLRVLRPAGVKTYTAFGSFSATAPSGTEPILVPLRIQAGDTIGLEMPAGTPIGLVSPVPGSSTASWVPPLAEGSTLPYTASKAGREFAFNAEVQPAPTIASLNPESGYFRGGTRLKISGADFTGVTGVEFGSVKAQFRINSRSQILTTAPAMDNGSVARVAVTTVAGRSAAGRADRFRFTACVVPNLKARRLAAARRAVKKAECRIGGVTRRGGVSAKSGRVVKQSPRRGTRLRPGARVSIALG